MNSMLKTIMTSCVRTINISNHPPVSISVRGRKNWMAYYLRDMYRRRTEQGPEEERPRSAWYNWNYQSELYSFGKRLGEDFNKEALQTAFTNKSYVTAEEQKRAALGVEDEVVDLGLQDNEELAKIGLKTSQTYIKAYLRSQYPSLPEEGISGICDYLLSEDTLSHVAENIGVRDLVLTEEFPAEKSTIVKTFAAVIGALEKSKGKETTHLFVRDFLVAQLGGKDLSELYDVKNAMGLLSGILASQGKEAPEPRLLRQTGSNTITSVYIVGIYTNKELIGQSAGETATIAEELAAKDALRRIFGTSYFSSPLNFNDQNSAVNLDIVNKYEIDYTKQNQLQ